MNLKPYIESGILELYALNLLAIDERRGVERMLATYPELRVELNTIEGGLEGYALSNSVEPSNNVEELIVGSLMNLQKEKAMDPADLPLINRYSDYRNWMPLITSFGQCTLGDDGRHIRMLRQDDKVTQMLIVSTTDIETETHEDEYESFLIISGECKCTVGTNVRLMTTGDYMEIPLHEWHDVSLISSKVMAILQRVKVGS